MDSATLAVGKGQFVERGLRSRATAVVVGLAIVLATLILVQHRADASPARAAVAAVAPSAGAAVPQIDVAALIRSIVCPLLNALATGPLGSFIGFIINALRASFGCVTLSG